LGYAIRIVQNIRVEDQEKEEKEEKEAHLSQARAPFFLQRGFPDADTTLEFDLPTCPALESERG